MKMKGQGNGKLRTRSIQSHPDVIQLTHGRDKGSLPEILPDEVKAATRSVIKFDTDVAMRRSLCEYAKQVFPYLL